MHRIYELVWLTLPILTSRLYVCLFHHTLTIDYGWRGQAYWHKLSNSPPIICNTLYDAKLDITCSIDYKLVWHTLPILTSRLYVCLIHHTLTITAVFIETHSIRLVTTNDVCKYVAFCSKYCHVLALSLVQGWCQSKTQRCCWKQWKLHVERATILRYDEAAGNLRWPKVSQTENVCCCRFSHIWCVLLYNSIPRFPFEKWKFKQCVSKPCMILQFSHKLSFPQRLMSSSWTRRCYLHERWLK